MYNFTAFTACGLPRLLSTDISAQYKNAWQQTIRTTHPKRSLDFNVTTHFTIKYEKPLEKRHSYKGISIYQPAFLTKQSLIMTNAKIEYSERNIPKSNIKEWYHND